MDSGTVKLFHDSLDRCTRGRGFIDAFYDRFMGQSDDIARLFQDADMASQRRKLQASLYVCMQAATGDEEAQTWVRRMALRHTSFPTRFYQVWLDSLIETARAFDPFFNAEIESAWREMLRPGIEIFQSEAA